MGNSPIVARINSILAEKGISKQKFYEDCHITSASYSLWNTGKTSPRAKNLEIIADYLDVTVEYLQTGLGQKEKPAHNVDEPNLFDASDAELLSAFKNAPDYKKDAIRDLLGLK